ncbi:MAG TPA: penicillin-binding transpeptidase domain-containing protein [Verrucomicrobiota bacterium]|nr:hypothetical protein [Verrucomicrobiales bacterium]HRI12663.1 penicillin-binding transpeptidase domain-containing protein [Verrucomicrobiota bacterium]
MLLFDQLNKGDRPLRVVAWGVLGGLALLLIGLWKVQVLSGEQYRERQESQSFRTVRVPAMRGKILDRAGRELAGNTPRYQLDLYLDELRPQFEVEYKQRRAALVAAKRATNALTSESMFEWLTARFRKPRSGPGLNRAEIEMISRASRFAAVSNTVAEVSRRLRVPLTLSEPALHQHYLTKRALPLTLIANCSPSQVALITEQSWNLPGVELELVPVRRYPHNRLASHVVGHLRRDDDYDEEEGRFDYRMRDFRGAMGLEAAFDRELRGQAGARSILVNSAGYRHRQGEEFLALPQAGLNLITTLDLDLQIAVEKALSSVRGDERGAVVVLDPNNGDVLALASAPDFDPTEFLDGVSEERWTNFFLAEPATPMMNRATYGQYAPGSTFKIIDVLALLENGVSPTEIFTVDPDPARPGRGAYYLGRRKIEDTAPPGDYDLRRAFVRSSNSYFIDHGLRLGWDRLLSTGLAFGFGQRTGIRIPEEKSGNFPNVDQVKERGWTAGNLANVCIGQEITVTPLQLAVAVSAVANGGKVFWPRLVDRIEPQDPLSATSTVRVKPGQFRSEINARPRHFNLVRAAMRDDVLDDEGTGKTARIEGFEICGKTGTAEIKGNGRKDKVTWFASYAPYEAPRYVVIVMVESGGSGGGTCAPVARQIYEFLHHRELGRTPGLVAVGGTP